MGANTGLQRFRLNRNLRVHPARMIRTPGLSSWKAASLVWTQFEDSPDWVAFNPLSGEVHLINEAARRLWILASDGQARSIDTLATAIAAPGVTVADEALELTLRTLTFMDDTGLLYPA
jgi:hypothetical protein